MSNTGNHYRKVRALVAKTIANGCEPAEAASALSLASKIIEEHKLNASLIDWPTPPTGYEWRGEPGQGGRIEEAAEVAPTPKPAKPKKAKKPKAEKPAQPASDDGTPKPRRPGTNAARVVEWLQRPGGVTLDHIVKTLNVQAHTARAMVSVESRRLGRKAEYDRATKIYRMTA